MKGICEFLQSLQCESAMNERMKSNAPWHSDTNSNERCDRNVTHCADRAPRLHIPAMVKEVVHYLACYDKPSGIFVDLTVGTGGHAEAILEAAPRATLIGIDRDESSLEVASERLARFGNRVVLIHGDLRDVQRLLAWCGVEEVDGCLIDPGMSLWQVDQARGFSFRIPAELDMRYDRSQRLTARELVNTLSVEQLTHLFEMAGERRNRARNIAKAIAQARSQHSIETTTQLAAIIADAVKAKRHQRIHPATKPFMALRMAVNDEADALERGTKAALHVLRIGGRIVVLTYQSIEDRIVKRILQQHSQHISTRLPSPFPESREGEPPP
ncbi:MAG TPA: 16S rRNA (cytosine(1402)-N(4))-methyltransferase RsmH, partial [Armatimonadetes bacterium]|nr:16S rRNA (cytosine(1402)-N(4))-methyltransferase RsmH [Armatimonadota bacterium]